MTQHLATSLGFDARRRNSLTSWTVSTHGDATWNRVTTSSVHAAGTAISSSLFQTSRTNLSSGNATF